MRFFIILALIAISLASLVPATHALLHVFVNTTDGSFNQTLIAPRILRFGGPFDTISGRLVLANATREEKQGEAVLAFYEPGWSWDRIVRREFNEGAKLVVTVSRGYTEVAGGTDFVFDGSDVSDIKIPVVEIILRHADWIRANLTAGANISITATCCDVNEWDEFNRSGWMSGFSVVIGGASTFVFGWALLKLGLQLRRAPGFTISTFTLILIVLSNLLRAIITTVDPILSRRTFPNPWEYIFFTITWPFTSIGTLLITFYWLELIKLNKKVVVSSFLSKLFWPFVVFGLVLLIVELASSVSRGLDMDITFLLYFSAALYVIIDLVVTCMFLWTGLKVLKQIREGISMTGNTSSRSRRLARATRLIMLSVAGNLIFILTIILGGFTSLLYHPVSYSVLGFFTFFGLIWTDVCKVWALRIPKSESQTVLSTSQPQSTATPSDAASRSITPDDI